MSNWASAAIHFSQAPAVVSIFAQLKASRYTSTEMSDSSDLNPDMTRLLASVCNGDSAAAAALLPEIYGEIRAIAAAHFRGHGQGGQTLQATALVNEAYIKLVEGGTIVVHDRKHFFVLMARIMRQVLVDHARTAKAQKRGGHLQRATLADVAGVNAPAIDLLALEEALQRLHQISPQRAQLVEMRFFGGLQEVEAADMLGISRAEASRQWRAARAWLSLQMRGIDDDDA